MSTQCQICDQVFTQSRPAYYPVNQANPGPQSVPTSLWCFQHGHFFHELCLLGHAAFSPRSNPLTGLRHPSCPTCRAIYYDLRMVLPLIEPELAQVNFKYFKKASKF